MIGTKMNELSQMTDSEIVARLKQGDHSVFPELTRRYRKMIFQLAVKLTKNESDAEDVVQDVFLTILEKIGGFREEAALSSWIYRVTVNASLMKLRKRSRRNWESLDENLPRFLDDGYRGNPVIDGRTHPDAVALSSEALELIRRAISRLPEKYRLPFLLQNFEGQSLKEIGEAMDLTIPTVKIRLHRARLFLRQELGAYYGITPKAKSPISAVATAN
jgi:RNA polymerase sigma-70 factor (ECF subfamily)